MQHIWQQISWLEYTFDYEIKNLQIKNFIGTSQLKYTISIPEYIAQV